MKSITITLAATGTALLLGACGRAGDRPETGAEVEVRVAPLNLPGIGFACFDVRVSGAAGTVWALGDPALTRLGADQAGGVATGAPDAATVCSNRYGSGPGGDIAYVGPCDATSDSDGDATNGVQNRVTIWVDGLYDAAGTSDVGGWSDPCPGGCSRHVDCDPNRDSPAEFDLTVMRSAGQGFFDLGVDLDDIFCSAKLDTCYGEGSGDEPIRLLFGAGGGRDWTAVFGLACTAGPGAGITTELLYGDVTVTCGDARFPIDVRADPGNNDVTVGGRTLHYGVYRDDEGLLCDGLPCNKRYWNLAFSLDDLAGFGLGTCTLELAATATGGSRFVAGLPVGTGVAWPYVTVATPVTSPSGQPTCQRHPLGVEGSALTTTYAGTLDGLPEPPVMCSRFAGGTPEPTGGFGCPENPDPGPCPDGLTTFDGDLIVDAASALTPADLLCVEAITGNLTITGVDWTTLALPNLTTVGGTLTIDGTDLTSLDLPALTSAAGVVITDNPGLSECALLDLVAQITPPPALVDLTGNGLETVTGDLVIDAGTTLTPADLLCVEAITGNLTITGVDWTALALPNLTSVGGTLTIDGTDLASLDLPALTSAAGVVITDNPGLSECDLLDLVAQITPPPALVDISGNGLETITGDLVIDAGTTLTPADLLCVEAITGNLTIAGVDWTTLALPNLTTVGGALTIDGTDLTSLDLPALTSAAGVVITNNAGLSECDLLDLVAQITPPPALVDLSGNGLETITGDLVIDGGTTLTPADLLCVEAITGNLTITGVDWTALALPNLTSVGGTLTIDATDLTSLDLPALTSAAGVVITNNAGLSECDLLDLVAQITPPPALVDLSGNGLETLTGDLVIDAGTTLTPADLVCIASITGDLTITGIDWTTLALPNLTTVGGTFTIDGTDLTSLDLPALTSAAGVVITNNPGLSECDLLGLVAQVSPPPALVDLSGNGLETITGDLVIDGGTTLTPADLLCVEAITGSLTITGVDWTALALPNLTSVGGTLTIDGTDLTSLDLPALTSAAGVVITNNPGLSECDLLDLVAQITPAPTTVDLSGNIDCPDPGPCPDGLETFTGDLVIDPANPPANLACLGAVTGNLTIAGPGGTTLVLPNLTAVGGTLTIANTDLTAVALPALTTAGGIAIDGNDVLNALDLSALTTADPFEVTDNPSLSTCDVEAIVAQLSPAPTTVDISGNGLETFNGDLVIDPANPPANLACLGAVTGNLTIAGPGGTTLVLPNLTAVGGTLTIANTDLTAVALPALTTAGGIAIDGNDILNALDLSALTTADPFEVTDNPALSTCDIQATAAQLTPAPTTVDISGNGLETFVGDLVIDPANPPANLACLGAVTGNLTITGPGGTTLALPNLTSVGGTLTIANTDLTAVALPALTTAGGIAIDGNDVLNALDLSALTTADPFEVTDNPALSTCDVQAIVAQLSPAPTTVDISGNGLETFVGDLVIDPANPPTNLACLGAVTGNLTITGPGGTTLALPNLTAVDGTLTIANTDLTAVALPALTTAGGIAIDGNDVLNALDLSALTTADPFEVTDNPALSTCDIQATAAQLTPAPTTVDISGNGLETFNGDLVIDPANPPANLGCLGAVTGNLTITGPGGTTLALPNLTAVGGTLAIANTDLTAVALPALTTAGGIAIDGNDVLNALDLSALTTADPFEVTDNPVLSTCDIEAIVAQLTPAPTTVDLTGNLDCTDPGPDCPDGPQDVVGNVTVNATGIFLDAGTPVPLTREELFCIRSIDGDLLVQQSNETVLELPLLETVTGLAGALQNAALTSFRLPKLTAATTVGAQGNPVLDEVDLRSLAGSPTARPDVILVENPTLRTVVLTALRHAKNVNIQNMNQGGPPSEAPALDLSRLETVEGIAAVAFSSLPAVDLSALSTVGGSFFIAQNALDAATVSSLATVGQSLVVSGNTRLATLSLPSVTSTKVLAIESNQALATIALDQLPGDAMLQVRLNRNAALVSFSMAALAHTRDFVSYENPLFATLSLPDLARVETTFVIHDNASLPTCDVLALFDRVDSGSEQQANNKAEVVTGDLVIDGTTPAPYDLRCIGTVGGDVRILPSAFGAIDLQSLASVGGTFELGAPLVESLFVPLLADIGGDLDVYDCGVLALGFPLLERVGGALTITTSAGLASLEAPVLDDVGQLVIVGNPDLFYVTLNALAGHGDLVIDVMDNAELEYLVMPALAEAELFQALDNDRMSTCTLRALADAITSWDVTIDIRRNFHDCPDYQREPPDCPNGPETVTSLLIDENNPPPANLACIGTVTGEFVVSGSDLTALDLVLLSSVGSLAVTSNDALTSVRLPELGSAGAIVLADNDDLVEVDLGAVGGGPTFALDVTNNASLTTLTLTELAEADHLHVLDNPALSTCALRALVVQLGITDPGADVVFEGNLADCGDYDGNSPCPDGPLTVADVTIDASSPPPPNLHCIAVITGALTVQGSDVNALALPLLTSAGAIFVQDNTTLASFGVPSLTAVGTFYALDNPQLSTCALLALLPQLADESPDADIVFERNAPDCPDYDSDCPGGLVDHVGNLVINASSPAPDHLGCIRSISDSLIVDGSDLTTLDMPFLTTVGASLNVIDNATLTTVSLPALASAAAVYIADNDALGLIDLDALEGYWTVPNTVPGLNFSVGFNDVLTTLRAASLDSAQNFSVITNPLLPMCAVYDLREQLAPLGHGAIVNNLADGCPNVEW